MERVLRLYSTEVRGLVLDYIRKDYEAHPNPTELFELEWYAGGWAEIIAGRGRIEKEFHRNRLDYISSYLIRGGPLGYYAPPVSEGSFENLADGLESRDGIKYQKASDFYGQDFGYSDADELIPEYLPDFFNKHEEDEFPDFKMIKSNLVGYEAKKIAHQLTTLWILHLYPLFRNHWPRPLNESRKVTYLKSFLTVVSQTKLGNYVMTDGNNSQAIECSPDEMHNRWPAYVVTYPMRQLAQRYLDAMGYATKAGLECPAGTTLKQLAWALNEVTSANSEAWNSKCQKYAPFLTYTKKPGKQANCKADSLEKEKGNAEMQAKWAINHCEKLRAWVSQQVEIADSRK